MADCNSEMDSLRLIVDVCLGRVPTRITNKEGEHVSSFLFEPNHAIKAIELILKDDDHASSHTPVVFVDDLR